MRSEDSARAASGRARTAAANKRIFRVTDVRPRPFGPHSSRRAVEMILHEIPAAGRPDGWVGVSAPTGFSSSSMQTPRATVRENDAQELAQSRRIRTRPALLDAMRHPGDGSVHRNRHAELRPELGDEPVDEIDLGPPSPLE